MTRMTVAEETQGAIDRIDTSREGPAWAALASAGIMAIAETADAVRDVAAAIREARS